MLAQPRPPPCKQAQGVRRVAGTVVWNLYVWLCSDCFVVSGIPGASKARTAAAGCAGRRAAAVSTGAGPPGCRTAAAPALLCLQACRDVRMHSTGILDGVSAFCSMADTCAQCRKEICASPKHAASRIFVANSTLTEGSEALRTDCTREAVQHRLHLIAAAVTQVQPAHCRIAQRPHP